MYAPTTRPRAIFAADGVRVGEVELFIDSPYASGRSKGHAPQVAKEYGRNLRGAFGLRAIPASCAA